MNDEPRQPDVNGQEPEWEAFARFVAGEGDPVEAAAVEAWLASHPADAQLAAGVKAHAEHAAARSAVPLDVEAAWRRVQAATGQNVAASASPPRLTVSRGGGAADFASTAASGASSWVRRGVLAIAATAVAVIGLKSWSGSRAGSMSATAQVLATKVGQRDSIVLSDGTRVVLAPGSRLTVAAGYDRGDRSVTLDGAAYFDVIHDDAHPFTVKAGAAEIRDVGTAFTVKIDDGGRVAVAVTHGIVTMRGVASSSAPAPVELQAGDRAVLNDGAVAVARGTVTDDETTWTRGQLSYRDAALSEVQADLRRWYGIELQVPDEKLAALTVTMPAQPDSATVMRTLVALLGAEMEQHGDTIILRSAGRGTIH